MQPGHSYANSGNGGENNHLVIDLAKMKAITVNGESATIQAGNRLGEVATTLNTKGRALPHGTCEYGTARKAIFQEAADVFSA